MIEYNLISELVGALNKIGKYFRGCPGFPPLSTGNDPNTTLSGNLGRRLQRNIIPSAECAETPVFRQRLAARSGISYQNAHLAICAPTPQILHITGQPPSAFFPNQKFYHCLPTIVGMHVSLTQAFTTRYLVNYSTFLILKLYSHFISIVVIVLVNFHFQFRNDRFG
ncbi:hypothetical protein TcasGA2_TC004113 [Tribolium castaneum]|uniref:Uncharacterized protein n=1 Tax=Tribolium castaneum TaxID=7070 RepID=D6W6S1_TRICA|nr:hypothetical protein TcasGA2_TC004113 [Tribolium castaneum]